MPRPVPAENPIREEDIQPYDDAPIVTSSGVRERARDAMQLTKEQQALILPGHTPFWGRDGRVWSEGEGGDRIQEILDCCDGAEAVRNEKRELIRKGRDLVLLQIPNKYVEESEAETEMRKREGERTLNENPYEPGVYSSHEKLFDPADRDQVEERKLANSAAMIRAGMIGPGSPTSGMSLLQAERMYSDAQIDAEEARWRRGGAHIHMDDAQWQEMLTGADDRKSRGAKPTVGYSKNYADNYDAAFGKKAGAGQDRPRQKGR